MRSISIQILFTELFWALFFILLSLSTFLILSILWGHLINQNLTQTDSFDEIHVHPSTFYGTFFSTFSALIAYSWVLFHYCFWVLFFIIFEHFLWLLAHQNLTQTDSVDEIHVHPSYNNDSHGFDIALLRLISLVIKLSNLSNSHQRHHCHLCPPCP